LQSTILILLWDSPSYRPLAKLVRDILEDVGLFIVLGRWCGCDSWYSTGRKKYFIVLLLERNGHDDLGIGYPLFKGLAMFELTKQ